MHRRVEALQKVLIGNRPLFEDLVKRRFIYGPSAEIYGGSAGLFDYGPLGAGIKNNLINRWRKDFVVAEDMFEMSCASLTPAAVLRSSGHTDRFSDFMVRDLASGEALRADHLLEEITTREINKPDCASSRRAELEALRASAGGLRTSKSFDEALASAGAKGISPSFEFNLMVEARLGPAGEHRAFLRPETAQSIFCNFRKLLDLAGGKLPFGAAMVGPAFRNEVAPRNGLVRLREFEMAEVEFFVDPKSASHPRLSSFLDLSVPVVTRSDPQKDLSDASSKTLGALLHQGALKSEVLAYFIGKTLLFAKSIGLKEDLLRFRQHQSDELSHYAADCWDLEVLTSLGWIECAGIADRGTFDLQAHARGSGASLYASRRLDSPRRETTRGFRLDPAAAGKAFAARAKPLIEAVADLPEQQFQDAQKELESRGFFEFDSLRIPSEMIRGVIEETRNVHEEKFVPGVIEPSFGIGRLVFAMLEHSFSTRDDSRRGFLALKPSMAAFKALVLPLTTRPELLSLSDQIIGDVKKEGLTCRSDPGSSAIGRRYARNDELGIPFAITVDFQTIQDDTVTLREIASMEQVRLSRNQAVQIVKNAVDEKTNWEEIKTKFPRAEPLPEDS